MADFIPTQDAQFKLFAEAFASGVASAPWTYGVSPSDAETISNAVQTYVDALATASARLTRTEATVNAKDTARNACRNLLRMYAQQFRANMGISNDQLIAIGVHRRPSRLGKRQCPQTSPVINFQARTPGCDQLTFGDALDQGAGTKKKPYGAERLELFVAYDHDLSGGQLPPSDAIYLGSFRKNPILVRHGEHAKDGEPTYWGRWAGHNDDVSPWSLPATLVKVRAQLQNANPTSAEAGDQPLRKAA
jgi:hypothetical protein